MNALVLRARGRATLLRPSSTEWGRPNAPHQPNSIASRGSIWGGAVNAPSFPTRLISRKRPYSPVPLPSGSRAPPSEEMNSSLRAKRPHMDLEPGFASDGATLDTEVAFPKDVLSSVSPSSDPPGRSTEQTAIPQGILIHAQAADESLNSPLLANPNIAIPRPPSPPPALFENPKSVDTVGRGSSRRLQLGVSPFRG
ncbi:unnamed protein product [Somion occarium]|uniref:Uncharacterized protein n=1 Tax=Somion occarium TaxID=3059160 RepID=A0ABP1DSU5_9APHY